MAIDPYADNLQSMVGYLRSFVPELPQNVGIKMVRDAYRRLLDWPDDGWSFQYGQGLFVCHTSIFGNCDVVQGSTTVSNCTTALPGDSTTIVGRQILFGGQAPVYSIVDNTTTTSLIMDAGYGGTTGTVGFEVTNVYFTPSDPNFESMKVWVDAPNGCQLPYSFSFEELDNIDPQRSASGTPYLLADVDWNYAYLAALPNGVTDSFGQTNASTPVPRKEIYPRQTANYCYNYFYKKWQADLIAPTDTPLAFFARRGEVIRARAMADLAMWEGPAVLGRRANPVQFNVQMKIFQDGATDLQIKDQSIFQRSFSTYLSATKMPWPASLYGSSFAMIHPQLGADVGLPFAGFDEW